MSNQYPGRRASRHAASPTSDAPSPAIFDQDSDDRHADAGAGASPRSRRRHGGPEPEHQEPEQPQPDAASEPEQAPEPEHAPEHGQSGEAFALLDGAAGHGAADYDAAEYHADDYDYYDEAHHLYPAEAEPVPAPAPSRRRLRTPGSVKKKQRRRRTIVMLAVVLVFAAVVTGVVLFLQSLLDMGTVKDYEGTGKDDVTFTVQSGWGPIAISEALVAQDIVASKQAFIDGLNSEASTNEIHPGEYPMKTQMSGRAAAQALLADTGEKQSYAAVKRGLRQNETFDVLATATGLSVADFQAAAADPSAFGLPAQAPSLEGYLYPGEYRFPLGSSAVDILKTMVKATTDALVATGVTDPGEQYRVLTIGSIIEAEAGEADYATVSGAIENRLGANNTQTFGLIQSDATVTYGLGRKSYEITPTEKADTTNPYNTYAHPGLPVGPIGSPGKNAIVAAAHPAPNDFYYWVTVNLDSGETKFSRTLAEHNGYVAEYRQWCTANPGRCL